MVSGLLDEVAWSHRVRDFLQSQASLAEMRKRSLELANGRLQEQRGQMYRDCVRLEGERAQVSSKANSAID